MEISLQFRNPCLVDWDEKTSWDLVSTCRNDTFDHRMLHDATSFQVSDLPDALHFATPSRVRTHVLAVRVSFCEERVFQSIRAALALRLAVRARPATRTRSRIEHAR